MFIEYITNLFIDKICAEIETRRVALFNSHVLLKTQDIASMREAQMRFIFKPINDRLLNNLREQTNLEKKLNQILLQWQAKYPLTPGYIEGDIANFNR